MKRLVCLVLCLLLVSSFSSLCFAEKDAVELGILVYKQDETFASAICAAINKWAEEIGAEKGIQIEINMQNGNNDQATQNDQASVMLAKGVDALCINLVDETAGATILDMAADFSVPCLFYNKEPRDTTIIGDHGSIYIGCKPEESGVMQGEAMITTWEAHPEFDKNNDGTCQYLMFQGDPSNLDSIARTQYSVSTAEEHGIGMELLSGELYICDWDASKAQQAMTAALANYGDSIELVFANNDQMAMGIIAALNEYGYNTGVEGDPFIPVLGVDADESALEAIAAGKMSATVKNDADSIGKAVVLLGLNAALGQDWLADTDFTIAEDGYSIRIPYVPVLN